MLGVQEINHQIGNENLLTFALNDIPLLDLSAYHSFVTAGYINDFQGIEYICLAH